MRIWAFPSFYPFDRPGMKWVGIFAHRQFKALQEIGADIKVIQPVMWHPGAPFSALHKDWKLWSGYNYPKTRDYDGLTVYHPRIANMKPGRIFSKPYAERYVDSIVRFFNDNNIKLSPATDIFYAQWIPDAAMVQQAAHRLGIKSAVLIIGDDVLIWPHSGKRNMELFKDTMTNADMRMAVAGYLAAESNKLTGTDLPFSIIRRGVNYDFFKPALPSDRYELKKEFGIPEDKIVILSIGSAIVRKGWLDMLDALKEIKAANDNFVLVAAHGGNPEFDLQAEAISRGLGGNLVNLGEVDPKKINKLYNTADIFCLASHWEGIANSVVEAMSSGVAVITTDVCGHPELITSGQNGILVPAKDPVRLAHELSALINDKNRREELGNNARNFIVNQWGDFAFNARILYKRLCG